MKQDLITHEPRNQRRPAESDTVGGNDLPRLPQFSIRTLLLLVAGCGLLFALMRLIGPVWSAMLAWFVVLVAAHVTANAWGTWLKRHQPRQTDDRPAAATTLPTGSPRCAPVTRLRLHASLGRGMVYITAIGAVVGAVLGSYLLLLANWGRVGIFGLLLGTLSTAVIGGFLGFLASSFIEVAGKAWKEAQQDAPRRHRQDPGRDTGGKS